MYLSDIHTHSIASGHGTTCTISDMAKAASQKGLKLLGITDHGPATLAAGTSSYFRSLTYAPKKRFGIELLFGAELNILDTEGHLDLNDELLSELDYAIASMHAQNYKSGTVEENTSAYLNAMRHPCVKVLGHCDNPAFPVDYETLAFGAREYGVIFEINEASLMPDGYRGDTKENNREILKYCMKYEIPIVLSSDSHGAEHIGDFTYGAEFVHEMMLPERLILNNDIHRLKRTTSCFIDTLHFRILPAHLWMTAFANSHHPVLRQCNAAIISAVRICGNLLCQFIRMLFLFSVYRNI